MILEHHNQGLANLLLMQHEMPAFHGIVEKEKFNTCHHITRGINKILALY